MQVNGSKVLILGGWGLVGSAICNELMKYSPAQIIISSLRESEAKDAVQQLQKEYPNVSPNTFIPVWGNIFTRKQWKDDDWNSVLSDANKRKIVIDDIFNELNNDILENSALYSIISEHKPDIVIDCINTATAIAYMDIYTTTNNLRQKLNAGEFDTEIIERMIASVYIPQLIRHIQILYKAFLNAGTKLYLKIGTSGSGGMGLNIPYTHSEERPSRVLLSKAAVAGAQSLLLFLMARTPDAPIVKEIKPTAAIAWKRIEYGKVMRKGRPIPLVDMSFENARTIQDKFKLDDYKNIIDCNKDYESAFIDTGENGIFSKGEFKAIGALGQMEIVTPEEIAIYAVKEILGGNTGFDIIQGLDAFSLGPTYRGGMLYNNAIRKLEELEKLHQSESIAFEMLGPPRLSKLLFEAHLLKLIAGSMKKVLEISPEELSQKAEQIIKDNSNLRSQMLSIGLVILLSDGKSYLRGKDVIVPSRKLGTEFELTQENIEKWTYEGWVDLRTKSFEYWQNTLKQIIDQAEAIPENDTSSRYTYTKDYWNNFQTIDEGKIVGWIFEHIDQGWRYKR